MRVYARESRPFWVALLVYIFYPLSMYIPPFVFSSNNFDILSSLRFSPRSTTDIPPFRFVFLCRYCSELRGEKSRFASSFVYFP